jgi:hypothetical protein
MAKEYMDLILHGLSKTVLWVAAFMVGTQAGIVRKYREETMDKA